MNLILARSNDFLKVVKAIPIIKQKGSKLPENDIDYGVWKFIESQPGGKLNMKQTGRDQTNSGGMISVQNCRKFLMGFLECAHQMTRFIYG